MAGADGSITINSKLDNREFMTDSKQLMSAIRSLQSTTEKMGTKMASSAKGYGSAMLQSRDAILEVEEEISRLEQKAAEMRRELELRGDYSGVKSFLELRKQIQAAENQLDAAIAKQEKARTQYGVDSTQFEQAKQAANELSANLDELLAKRNELERPSDADILAYYQQEQNIQAIESSLEELKQIRDEAFEPPETESWSSEIRKFATNAKAEFKKIGQAVKGFFGKKGAGGNGTFSLKSLLAYGFGIRSLFALFNKLRSAISAGLGELSKQDPRVRGALSSMSAALNGLKGSLSSAFSPILTAVAPAITTLINLLTQAVNAIGMFMAALTGQSYYNVAKGVSSIGSAAKGSSGSVKELNRQLSRFDELEILNANDSGGGGGGGGGGAGDMAFTKMPLDSGIKNFVDNLKELFAAGEYEEIGHIIADGINSAIDKTIQWISWDNLGESITQFIEAAAGIFNGFVERIDWKNIGLLIVEGFNTIIKTLDTLIKNINWGSLGAGIADMINGLFDNAIDWTALAKFVENTVKGVLDLAIGALKKFDIRQAVREVYKGVVKLVTEIDWSEIVGKIFELLGAALGGVGAYWDELIKTVGRSLGNASKKIGNYFKSEIQAAGMDYVKGFMEGISKALVNIGTWVYKNIFKPFMDAILSKFGIHSPATTMIGPGEDIVNGLLAGILNAMKNIGTWVKKNIFTPLMNAVKNAGEWVVELVAKVVTTAQELWDWIQEQWANAGDHILGVGVAIKQKATEVYEDFANAWEKNVANPVIDFLGKIFIDENDPLFMENLGSVSNKIWNFFGMQPPIPISITAPGNVLQKTKSTIEERLANAKATVNSVLNPVSNKMVRDGIVNYFTSNAPYVEAKINEVALMKTLPSIRKNVQAGMDGILVSLGLEDGSEALMRQANAGIKDLQTWVDRWPVKIKFEANDDSFIKSEGEAGLLKRKIQALVEGLEDINFGSLSSDVYEKIVSSLSKQDWKSAGSQISTKTASGIATILNNTTDNVKAWYNAYSKAVNNQSWSSVGSNISSGVAKGISNTASTIANAAKTAANNALAAAKKALGIKSPSRVFRDEVGLNIGLGLAKGLENSETSVLRSAASLSNALVDSMKNSDIALKPISASAPSLVDSLADRIWNYHTPAMASGSILPYDISAQIAKTGQDIQDTLDANNEDLIQTIINVAGQIVSALQRVQSPATRTVSGPTAQDIIDEINRRTQMFGASPLQGV